MGSHELKVIAVLLNAFDLSPNGGRSLASSVYSPSGLFSKSSVFGGLGEKGVRRRNSALTRSQVSTQ